MKQCVYKAALLGCVPVIFDRIVLLVGSCCLSSKKLTFVVHSDLSWIEDFV